MANPTTFSWTDPTTNVDGSPIASGEITGYDIGIRNVADVTASPGTYNIVLTAPGGTAASALMSQLATALVPGSYAAAIRTDGPVDSVYSSEVTFAIEAPTPPQPNPPTGFTVG